MEKDDVFWLNVFYLACGLIAYYVFYKAATTLGIEMGWAERYDAWWTPTDHLVSVVLGVAAVFWLKRDPERQDYFLKSIAEVRKVKWPSIEETRQLTFIVVVVVGVFAVILFGFDLLWTGVLNFIFRIF